MLQSVMLNKVATYDNLHNRGIKLANRMCVMCGNNKETISHLFFSCRTRNYIWKLCENWVGISSVHHERAREHFLQFQILGLSNKCNKVWRCIWVMVIGNIWAQRNNIIFKNLKPDV